MRILDRIDEGLARFEGWLIVLFLGAMSLLTLLQVCLRGLYTHGRIQWANALIGQLDWSEPLVRLLVLWVTFLGASLVTRDAKHIRIDLFSTLLPSRWLPARELLLTLCSGLICGVMVAVSITYLRLEMSFGATMFFGMPAWIGQLILPMGFASIFFRFVLRSLQQLRNLVKGASS